MYYQPKSQSNALRQEMNEAYQMDESKIVQVLLDSVEFSAQEYSQAKKTATALIEKVRASKSTEGFEALLFHYDLSCEEGVTLMCLAEALLRIPDKKNVELLIADKLGAADWEEQLGKSDSRFVNMATWGFLLSSRVLGDSKAHYLKSVWQRMVSKLGKPVIRVVVNRAMKMLGEQFVVGQTIEEALENSTEKKEMGYVYSYDMLGEVAMTRLDAKAYFDAYYQAILALGVNKHPEKSIFDRPSISIKLSALYPRYDFFHYDEAVTELSSLLLILVKLAKDNHVSVTVDAEECDRLDMSLDIVENVFTDKSLKNWEGFGLAVQAYQKRATYVIDWLVELAKKEQKRMQIRLVKGAYWDSEIKWAQEQGLPAYPLFTRKESTDVSYLVCARKMLNAKKDVYSQFATHNALSVSAVLAMIGGDKSYEFEFQNLQGMGKVLHDKIVSDDGLNLKSRIYAPVGAHEDLLPYLMRRLLENGANTSFVNRIMRNDVSVEELVENPADVLRNRSTFYHPNIPLPVQLFADRKNAMGVLLTDFSEIKKLDQAFSELAEKRLSFKAPKHFKNTKVIEHYSPACKTELLGSSYELGEQDLKTLYTRATDAFAAWSATDVLMRCELLRKIAVQLEEHQDQLLWLIMKEGGRILEDAVSELREAIDFCRYYAAHAAENLGEQVLPGPTGESNHLRKVGRGVVLAISPWNFPLAIFLGQITAGLVTGNCVIAKPARQTQLIANVVAELCYQAGVPKEVLQLACASGRLVNEVLINQSDIAGILFTGSNETAWTINQSLAQKRSAIIPFIAETGGMNAMIADSSALPEQLVEDVVFSAFDSAGQRCSALRVLFIQEDIADTVIKMLAGAMAELDIGDPTALATHVGPVIDGQAKKQLQGYISELAKTAKLIYQVDLPSDCEQGHFVTPCAYEIQDASVLKEEVFGPILHVVRYSQDKLLDVIETINDWGFGLTFGVHSRVGQTVELIQSRVKAGNIYVNRNTVGAVVGVQPFGGMGLSGTGPKAGGPNYLERLCQEQTITVNTTAVGGNASLMTLEDQ